MLVRQAWTAAGRIAAGALAALAAGAPAASAADLSIAAQNDQFAPVLVKMAARAKRDLDLDVAVDILSYPELLTKITADFVGDTGNYDLVTMDIVWAGQFAQAGYSVPLDDLVARDRAELDMDDIYPVLVDSLGRYDGRMVAFPFAGYANVLALRTDLYAAAGLPLPGTMEDLVAAARKLTDKAKGVYGFVANGQKGPAVAQDWMQYNSQFGGSIMGPDGRPALNSPANVRSLTLYKQLFDETAPPGAVEFDWSGREESFRQGQVANMESWSVGAPAYDNPAQSKVVGANKVVLAPVAKGMAPAYGVGGWALAINADIDADRRENAWRYIKWVTSRPVQKAMALEGAGGFLRRSTLADPELAAKYPFLPVIAETFEHGNGEYRPRIPQYPEIQDSLGTAVNAVLVGNADPKAALDRAQADALKLF